MQRIDPKLPPRARSLYESVQDLPIVSPHGHCDPAWWATDTPFPDPASLLIIPDHYVFRMLYSHGVPMADLGIGVPEASRNPRQIFQVLADNWHLFLGTPSREWLEFTLYETLGVDTDLTPTTADTVYDQIAAQLTHPGFRPRALFEQFNIEVLATTDSAIDTLAAHRQIKASGWGGRVVPTFRPDSVLDPAQSTFLKDIAILGEQTDRDTTSYAGYLDALRIRRAFFRDHGATATDHAVRFLTTEWLASTEIEALHALAVSGKLDPDQTRRFYGHMLVEMAQMSVEDGMVMQLHVGSRRDTNRALYAQFGPNMGADIPVAVDWVTGLDGLLNRVGNDPRLRVLLFTLDESTYARELAPMAGHWPSLRLGPPWWFHDSPNGMRRYLDRAVETAGYFNLAGFNDDTRAFLSIPARHDMWRQAVSLHLAEQLDRGRFGQVDAEMLAQFLCRESALEAYRLSDRSL